MTDLETGLLITTVVEFIVIGALLYKRQAKGGLVYLEPKIDKLKVDYWWIDEDDIPRDGRAPDSANMFKTTSATKEDYIYLVEESSIEEGDYKMVSKEESAMVSARIGAIKPPWNLPSPPKKPTLMAVDIYRLAR